MVHRAGYTTRTSGRSSKRPTRTPLTLTLPLPLTQVAFANSPREIVRNQCLYAIKGRGDNLLSNPTPNPNPNPDPSPDPSPGPKPNPNQATTRVRGRASMART